jgi:hypothetical protein
LRKINGILSLADATTGGACTASEFEANMNPKINNQLGIAFVEIGCDTLL